MNPTTNAAGRYGFHQLRERLGTDGHPIPERTARRLFTQIDRIRIGRRWVWTEAAVQQFEQKKTLKAA